MDLPNFAYPVVVDLSGMKILAKWRPILRDHRIGQIVGHTQTIEINGSSIRLVGVCCRNLLIFPTLRRSFR